MSFVFVLLAPYFDFSSEFCLRSLFRFSSSYQENEIEIFEYLKNGFTETTSSFSILEGLAYMHFRNTFLTASYAQLQ